MHPACASPCRVIIRPERVGRNFARLGDPARLIPVIKSDAYGHGLVPVAEALAARGARAFAVATVDEARVLREAGIKGEILVLLGAQTAEETAQARAAGVTLLIHDQSGMERAVAAGDMRVAIKWNTGMGRLGFAPEEAAGVIDRLRSLPALKPTLCLSHLAAADTPEHDAFTAGQIRVFGEIAARMKDAFPGLRASLANSAGLLAHPEAAFDAARPGIALYGGNPFHGTSREKLGADLECAMEAYAPILQIRTLAQDESAGYGRAFIASGPTRIGIAGIGYADGYARALSGRGVLEACGKRAPVVGRVCMGMIILDLTEIPEARPGDSARILGGPEKTAVTVHELAEAWNSIAYEVFCLLGRNARECK